MTEYREVTISGMTLEYRKWKVRDKMELDRIETDSNLSTTEKQIQKRKVFVYNCLKEPVILDLEQYNYVLSLIREYSLHTPIEFTLECSSCQEQFSTTLSTPEIITFREPEYKDISVGGLTFSFGNVRSPEYDRDILESFSASERFIVDLAHHVTELNGEEVQPREVIDALQDMDVDDYQELFRLYDSQRALCNFRRAVKCPHCENTDFYEFDNLTSFFPQSWSV